MILGIKSENNHIFANEDQRRTPNITVNDKRILRMYES